MNYEAFANLEDRPEGKQTAGIHGPLYFAPAEELVEMIADFSVIDDFMSDEEMDDFVEDYGGRFPDYQPIAVLDLGRLLKGEPDHHIDSYDEYFLAVDTAHARQRVMLWTGESFFEELFPSFEAFYASLSDWQPRS